MNYRQVLCLCCLVIGMAGCGSDGEHNSDDPTPSAAECGNGYVETGESCDDGNTQSGDGCSAQCQVESGWECLQEGSPCQKKTTPDPTPTPVPKPTKAVCGDGFKSGSEECDDGNTDDGDGCSAECTVEKGYDCSSGTCNPVAPGASCGNGTVEDDEECDDANTQSGDGCAANCLIIESGYACPKKGGACVKQEETVCGDGILTSNESCDDGNKTDGDGCSAQCQTEEGWTCPDQGAACVPVCGDGLIKGNEECDDANTFNTDGCSSECKIEPNFRCVYNEDSQYSICSPLQCGDGIVSEELGEQCDVPAGEGRQYGWDKTRHAPYCTLSQYNPSTGLREGGCAYTPYCGDGIVQEEFGEKCDDGDKGQTVVDEDGNPVGGTGEYGGCEADCRFAGFCGDGILNSGESCDDGNTADGDGCSADCKTVEQGWTCPKEGEACKKLTCGNGVFEPELNEKCDDGNFDPGDGCFNCRVEQGYVCQDSNPPCPDKLCKDKNKYCALISDLYGDGVVDAGFEECDDGNTIDGDGCSQGTVDPGYACPTPGKHCIAKECGDGIIAYGEECDDGNLISGDGCSYRCRLEAGYLCKTAGKPCEQGYCGDGIVQYGEECDEGAAASQACKNCIIQPGYQCPTAGGACKEHACGTGSITPDAGYASYKTCDDGNTNAGDGCSAVCRIETGYHCDENGKNCTKGKCGDSFLDVGEECDDGNTTPNDGCDPTCKRESMFDCYNGECKPVCGDGITMYMLGEECDDGNLISGDGCSADCKIETGFTCTDFSAAELPLYIDIPVTYRDFRYSNDTTCSGGGCITEKIKNDVTAKDDICKNGSNKNNIIVGKGFPDFQRYNGNGCYGMLENELDADGKPVMNKNITSTSYKCSNNSETFSNHYTCPALFNDYWYRDVEGVNKSFPYKLRMERKNAATGTYEFFGQNPPAGATAVNGKSITTNKQFTPINGAGYKTSGGGFTSEVSTYFQYKGGETLDFSGDDDVWVFINNKLFVDLGGMHSEQKAGNTLASDTCDNAKDKDGNAVTCDKNFGLYKGGIYPIKLFHAERQFGSSNFKLTLTGFVNTGKAECASVCGDGIVASTEQCDIKDHTNDAEARFNGCVECQKVSSCGNGILDVGETCDPGHWCNLDEYKTICQTLGIAYKAIEGCNEETCRYDNCGNGKLDKNEECDCKDGNFENGECTYSSGIDSARGCLDTCKVPTCGDGVVTDPEECDNGDANGDNAACTKKCTKPKCGDGFVQTYLGEKCDLGTDENGDSLNTGAYGKNGKPGCALDCTYETPYCGDGKIQTAEGEECDDGSDNDDNAYNGCTTQCKKGPRCGDGIIQGDEMCDDGEANGTDASTCTAACTKTVN